MIYQTDPQFHDPAIYHYGCYFLSLNERLSTLFGVDFTHEAVLSRLAYAQAHKIVDAEITILAPQMLCEYVTPGRVWFQGKYPAEYVTSDDEFEIVCYHKDGASFNHFCSGNGKGMVLYDPWSSSGSDSVLNGNVIGKRIYKIL